MSCTGFYNRHCFVVALFAMASTPAFSADLPPELSFNSQPIEALCFESVSADEWVDAGKCVAANVIKLPAKPEETWTADKIGYHYHYKEDASDAVSYSYYRYVGPWNGSPVIVSYGSGGGTGQFTSLMSIERSGAKLRVLQGFAAGDRCNGGIEDAKIEWGTLVYGQNMTPIDFFQLADDNPHDLQPYDDIEASATSCFGIARFKDEKFVGVTLLDIPQAQPGTQVTYKHQECFNKLFRELLAKGRKELSVAELKEFTGEFNRVCFDDDQPR